MTEELTQLFRFQAASDSYVTGRKNIIIEKLTELQFSLEVRVAMYWIDSYIQALYVVIGVCQGSA
eukprot:1380734-Amorphochlora_amoeboformis.AAC.1